MHNAIAHDSENTTGGRLRGARCCRTLAAFVCGLALSLGAGQARADDTDIYFANVHSSVQSNTVLGKVLFILDTSGSMQATGLGGKSFIQELREVLTTLLTESSNLAVGLMRFHDSYRSTYGGTVLFPVKPLDGRLADVVGEADAAVVVGTIRTGADDAHERVSMPAVAAVLTDTSLRVPGQPPMSVPPTVTVYAADDDNETVIYRNVGLFGVTTFQTGFRFRTASLMGVEVSDQLRWMLRLSTANLYVSPSVYLRFPNVALTQGAYIRSAELAMNMRRNVSNAARDPANMRVVALARDDVPSFTADPPLATYTMKPDFVPELSSGARDYGSAVRAQRPAIRNIDATTREVSFPVTDRISSIVNRAGWASGNALGLVVEQWDSYLYVGGATPQVQLGDTGTDAPRLDIQWGSATPSAENVIGLRFAQLQIPRGATIARAVLAVTGSATESRAVSWRIQAEAADDSAAFQAASGNISGRARTTNQMDWQVGAMVAGETYTTCVDGTCTGDLKDVVQEVVNRSGWCGGNTLSLILTRAGSDPGYRDIVTYEDDPGQAPSLEVAYTRGTGDCRSVEVYGQVQSSEDDTYRVSSSDPVNTGGRLQLPVGSRTAAMVLRFPTLPIPPGSRISDARLQMELIGTNNEFTGMQIRAILLDNVPGFDPGDPDDLYGQPVSSPRNIFFNRGASGVVTSTNLAPTLNAVMALAGRTRDSAIGLRLNIIPATPRQHAPLEFYSFDVSPSRSPSLRVTYRNTDPATDANQVRERLIQVVQGLNAVSATPTANTMLEAAAYWKGAAVLTGGWRGRFSRVSHPASYCQANADPTLDPDCRGATQNQTAPDPRPYTDRYGVEIVENCFPWALEDRRCAIRRIIGTARYLSPFTDLPADSQTCAIGNHQILMSDGEPNFGLYGSASQVRSGYSGLFGGSCATPAIDGELCVRELATQLATTDLSSTEAGQQSVKTHTVAFRVPGTELSAKQFLEDVAAAGEGDYYEANDAAELLSAFKRVLDVVRSTTGSSFVSPSLATNAFNRLLSRDEVYFGMFSPTTERSWLGNLKKFGICVDSTAGCTLGSILDVDGDNAVVPSGPNKDKFREDAKSYWSSVADGGQVTVGGAGEQIDDYTAERIYTDAPAPPLSRGDSLSSATTELNSTNWNSPDMATVRSRVCPTPDTAPGSVCEKLMLWWIGKSIDPLATDTSADTRWSVADVLHSSPAIISYGGVEATQTYYDRILVGTNDGGLRFVNANTGEQEWRFYPYALLSNLSQHYENQTGDHLYGVDGTPTLRVEDVDSDGVIEPADGDLIHAYFGLRRGGTYYYALDLSPSSTWTNDNNRVVPKYLWHIDPALRGADFSRMGQSWAQPVLTTLLTRGRPQQTLIFGGGYDPRLDNGFGTAATGGMDNRGNAIHFVDPDTGVLQFSITGNCSGACGNIEVNDMRHSIVARVALLDSDGDGYDDRLYVGDTGGQVWRVDLGTELLDGSARGTVVGRLAVVSDSADADKRKIFERASVIQVLDSQYSDAIGGEYDYVFVGTGDRTDPLETVVRNRFYALRDRVIGRLPDTDNDNRADSGYRILRNSDLVDITIRSAGLNSADPRDKSSHGWYYEFRRAGPQGEGEKVLSGSTVIAGTVYFTTYAPEAMGANPCEANIGDSRAYNFDVLSSKVAIDWDTSDSDRFHYRKDRVRSIGKGIPSDIVPVFTKEGVVGIVGIEGGVSQIGKLADLPRYRTYWYEDI